MNGVLACAYETALQACNFLNVTMVSSATASQHIDVDAVAADRVLCAKFARIAASFGVSLSSVWLSLRHWRGCPANA